MSYDESHLTIELQTHGLPTGGSREQRLCRLNKYINQEQRAELESHGLIDPDEDGFGPRELKRKIELLRELERKARVVVLFGSEGLPGLMDMARLRKELKLRRLSDVGSKTELENRLEHALLKDDCPHIQMQDDGYAYGRTNVSIDEYLENLSDVELRRRLKEDHKVEEVPRSKAAKIKALRLLLAEQVDAKMEEALTVVLREQLRQRKLPIEGECKMKMFSRLENDIAKTTLEGPTTLTFESEMPATSPAASLKFSSGSADTHSGSRTTTRAAKRKQAEKSKAKKKSNRSILRT